MTKVQLVCLHSAGGGSASFHPLRRALGADVAVTAVTLPGRESRFREPRLVDAAACVQQLSDELDETLRGPHVLLGHSLGGLLAYRLAQQRISRGLRAPEAVIVAASRAPHVPEPLVGLYHLDNQRLARELVQYGGLPVELLSEHDMLEVMLPIARADLRVLESYSATDTPPLPCPLHVFGGREDTLVTQQMLAPWSTYSVSPHPVRLFAGGHFLFKQPDPELVAAIRRVVESG